MKEQLRDVSEYFLFISYSRTDSKAAAYLQRKLEHFRIPVKLVAQENRPGTQKFIKPIFRDKRDLKISEHSFTEDIKKALDKSRFLLVLCSPNSADSIWVNEEIRYFLETHLNDYSKIVPIILCGRPGSNGANECLPPELRIEEITSRNLPTMIPDDGESEKDGWENGLVQALSFLLKVDREKIKATVDREKLRQMRLNMIIGGFFTLIFAVLTIWALHAERIADQNRCLAEKNEKRAIAGETLAKENEARAKANEKRAIAGETLAKENEARAKANEKRAIAGETLAKENEAQAKENEKRAIKAKQEAVEQERITSKTLLFVQEMLSEDKENKGANRSVKDVLAAQLIKIDKLEPEILKASVSEVVGLLFVQNSIFPPAEKLLMFAYNYYKKTNNTEKAGSAANNLGIYYSYIGNFALAEKYYSESFKPLKTEDVNVLCNLADNAQRNNQLEKAEKYARQAYNLSVQKYGKEAESTINAELQIAKALSDRGKTKDLNDLLNGIEKKLIKKNSTSSWAYCRLCNLRGVYYSMRGEFDKAEKYLAFEKEYTEKKFGKKSQHTALAYNNLGFCQYSQKKYGEAIKTLKAALEISRSVFPDGSSVEGQICHNLGCSYLMIGNKTDAFGMLQRALQLRNRYLGAKHADTAETLSGLAFFYFSQKEYEKALDYNKKALSIYISAGMNDSVKVAVICNNIGEIYRLKNDFLSALPQYQEALTIYMAVLGQGNMNADLASLYNNLALTYNSIGESEQAKKYINLAADYVCKHLPPNAPDRRNIMRNKVVIENPLSGSIKLLFSKDEERKIEDKERLAQKRLRMADTDQSHSAKFLEMAEKDFREILEYQIKTKQTDSKRTAIAYNQLGYIKLKQKKYEEANLYLKQALEINKNLFGETNVETLINYSNLFECARKLLNYYEAVKYGEKYLEMYAKVHGESTEYAVNMNNLAICYAQINDNVNMLKYFMKALQILNNQKEKDLKEIANTYINLAGSYSRIKEYQKSIACYRKGVEIREKLPGFSKTELALNYNNFAVALSRTGDLKQVLVYYRKALEINRENLGEDHLEVATNYFNIACVYEDMDDKTQEALEAAEKALNIRLKKLGRVHKDVFLCYNRIGNYYSGMGNNDKALENHRAALDIALRLYGSEDKEVATCYENIALCFQKAEKYQAALKANEKAITIRLLLNSNASEKIVDAYVKHGKIYEAMKDYNNASIYFIKAAESAMNCKNCNENKKISCLQKSVSASVKGEKYKNVEALLEQYCQSCPASKSRKIHFAVKKRKIELYIAEGKQNEANRIYQETLKELGDGTDNADSEEISMLHFVMAEALYRNTSYRQALSYYQKSLAIDSVREKPAWNDIRVLYENIASCYYEQGDYSQASDYYTKACKLCVQKNLNSKNRDTCSTMIEICKNYLSGKRIVFRVIKINPGENAERAGMKENDVFLAIKGYWTIMESPDIPHSIRNRFSQQLDRAKTSPYEILLARKEGKVWKSVSLKLSKGALGITYRYDYIPENELELYRRLFKIATEIKKIRN